MIYLYMYIGMYIYIYMCAGFGLGRAHEGGLNSKSNEENHILGMRGVKFVGIEVV